VTVDVSTNTVYLFRDGELIRKSAAATGSDKILRKGRRVWWFRTPRGRYEVVRRVKDPVWTKPDWAYVEEGKKVPPPDHPSRKDYDTLGKYAFYLGDRIMLHGTNDPRSIGRKVTHGCIRLPKDMLERMWREVSVGTPVIIFDSNPELARLKGSEKGINDLDL
jgi:L,D-transpeptidase YbiS